MFHGSASCPCPWRKEHVERVGCSRHAVDVDDAGLVGFRVADRAADLGVTCWKRSRSYP
jgi:hypothetical protein